MARIRHTGPVGSILTAKMGHNGGPQWDLTGKEYGFPEKNISTNWDTAQGIVVSRDGTALFLIAVVSGTYYLRQYNLPTPFDVSSIVGVTAAASKNLGSDLSPGLDVSPDGTKFIIRYSTGSVNVITCPTPWSLTGASIGAAWNTGVSSFRYQWMSADGLHLYQLGASSTIHKFTLAAPWTPIAAGTSTTTMTEATFQTPLLPRINGLLGSSWMGGRFSSDGKRFFGYASGVGPPTYWSIDLSTPNDLFSTRTFRGRRILVSPSFGTTTQHSGFYLGEEGKSIFFIASVSSTNGYITKLRFAP